MIDNRAQGGFRIQNCLSNIILYHRLVMDNGQLLRFVETTYEQPEPGQSRGFKYIRAVIAAVQEDWQSEVDLLSGAA